MSPEGDTPFDPDDVPALTCGEGASQLPSGRRDNLTLRRSLQDLLGLMRPPAGDLPRTERANGFSNARIDADGGLGEGFSVAWRSFITDVVEGAVRRSTTLTFPLAELVEEAGHPTSSPFRADEPLLNYRHGSPPIHWDVDIPYAATWELSIEVSWLTGWEDPDYPADPSVATWSVDGRELASWDVMAGFDAPQRVTVAVPLAEGTRRLALHPTWRGPAYTGFSTNVWQLGRFEAQAPLSGAEHLRVGHQEASCTPDTLALCARALLLPLARRAWRVSPSDVAVEAVVELVETAHGLGASVEQAIEAGVEFILSSPRFLMLPVAAGEGGRPLDALGLSDVLALALWRSVPDEELLRCADSGALLDPLDPACGLDVQVDRMLRHPRSDAMFEGFAVQWLEIERLDGLQRDPAHHGGISPQELRRLLRSARDELRENFLDLLAQDAALTDLIESPTRWLDERLAAHYGVGGPASAQAAAWGTTPEQPGLLGSAGILALTSHPNRTSPVERGVYVLGRLLCDPPAPPPPGVPLLPDPEAAADSRAALQAHTQDPACATCHERIDPVGFALEGFDALGAARSHYADGTPVSTRTSLPDGTVAEGLPTLNRWLSSQPAFEICVARNLFTWLQGRAPTLEDAALLRQMAEPEHPPTLGTMVSAWAMSPQARCTAPEARLDD